MKTTDKAIIEKLKEVNKVYKDFTSWIFRHTIEITQSIRGNEYINKIRQLESEIASLEAQDKEPSDENQCDHNHISQKNIRCSVCEDCGDITEVDI